MKNPLIIASCIALSVIVVLSALYFVAIPYQCSVEKEELIRKHQATIDAIDTIALTGESPAQKSEVFSSPRCPGQLTGDDYISVTKKYSNITNGGEAVDSVRNNLAKAGYTITNEYFGLDWGCKLTYDGSATKNDINVRFSINQDALRDPACAREDTFGPRAEAYFRAHDYDSISLTWSPR